MLRNMVLAGDKGTHTAYFGQVQTTVEHIRRHDCAAKYMAATRAPMGGLFKILNLTETLLVYLLDTLYLPVAVTGDKYCMVRFGEP